MWIDQTGRVFTTHTEIRASLPVSLPEVITDEALAQVGILPVRISEIPAFNPDTETYDPDAPVQVGEEWVKGWKVRPLTDAEKQERFDLIKSEIILGIQARLDAFAKTRDYFGILSLCTYAGVGDTSFEREGRYGQIIRSQTWGIMVDLLNQVDTGKAPMPSSYAEIEPLLPNLAWPD